MEGYEVMTSDDEKVGEVTEVRGEYVIVEHGAIFKSRHAVPKTFANVDEDARVVRLTVSKELVHDGPKFDEESFDESAVGAYYGVGDAGGTAETEGYGQLDPSDPAYSAQVEGRSAGVMPADEERARVRESMRPEGQDPLEGRPERPIYGGPSEKRSE